MDLHALTYTQKDCDEHFFSDPLASCLINAQPLLAPCPAADDNSLIGCTGHDLTDDWSLPSTHFVDSLCPYDVYLGMWPATQVNSAWPSLHG